MASEIVGNLGVPLTCECEHEFRNSVRELKANTEFTCPPCGATFNPIEFKARLEAIEKQAEDFQRKLREFSK